ncbi:DUF4389 domain-containing protein [Pseudonocardia sp.]|uniref:DUF4389 domain-containing protein n=1 Tax=Pseudonocardia sp. TaxID=60912 RepID=UPI003D0CE2BF
MTTAEATPSSPVRVDARLDPGLSRWLWLVKWLLLIPHIVVLLFLWIAFGFVTLVAWVAILVTARYPRALFDFALGVLRWTWRVQYYGYAGLGTDRYPPFTLSDVPDYPARIDVAYPERLSRGLALVKWWLLAIPHYMILAVLVGGTPSTSTTENGLTIVTYSIGLLTLLVFFAALALLFTARYPRGIYNLVLGIDRWSMRVFAYVALMTDAYPPFRLDQGGAEPRPVDAGEGAPPPSGDRGDAPLSGRTGT